MQPKEKYAFFDFDETIVSVKSMFAFKQALMSEQGYSPEAFDTFMQELKQRAEVFPRSEVNRWFYSTLKGVEYNFAKSVAKRWRHNLTSNVYLEQTCQKIQEFKQQGYQIVVVSGSARFIISEFLKELGISQVLCSTPEVKNNTFTGELIGEPVIGMQKRQSIQAFLREEDTTTRDLIVVGDHISDLPMLELATHAMVVNPDEQLKSIAHQKGWLEL
ncbi:HAD family hydrolase [Vibrio ouci]|uniref:HAD-IB family hydrolase n=1 Tax=Vibrio ouci TaxID=2499078 RepID=A0A4Y8WKE4_9VIBR|nr:HAD-IB family hydrolase [Vibrio ouci]TFH93392.1 HAD-IB family hydrolase [Vibrio ouci]